MIQSARVSNVRLLFDGTAFRLNLIVWKAIHQLICKAFVCVKISDLAYLRDVLLVEATAALHALVVDLKQLKDVIFGKDARSKL